MTKNNNNVPLAEVAKFKTGGKKKASLKELNDSIKPSSPKILNEIDELKAHDGPSNKKLKSLMKKLSITQTSMANYLGMMTGASVSAWINETNGVKGIPPNRIEDVKTILRGQYYLVNLIPVVPAKEEDDNGSMPKTRFDPILQKGSNTDYPGSIVGDIMEESYERPFKYLHRKNQEMAEMCENFQKAQRETYFRNR